MSIQSTEIHPTPISIHLLALLLIPGDLPKREADRSSISDDSHDSYQHAADRHQRHGGAGDVAGEARPRGKVWLFLTRDRVAPLTAAMRLVGRADAEESD